MKGHGTLRMLWCAALIAGPLSLAPSAEAQTVKLAVITESSTHWPVYAAQAKGMFEKEGLTVQMTITGSSKKQIEAMNKGEFDIGHSAAANVISAVQQGSDFIIVMALNLPAYSIVTAPTIVSFEDLKGKVLAVDSARTGYALLLKKILAQKGLKEGDYTLKEVGGTTQRIEAVKSGAAVAALINQPSDLQLFAQGYKSLGNTSDYFPHFQGSVAATKRSWAARNADILMRYVRAYVAASDWLLDRKNREEAIEILLRSVKRFDRAQANATYEGGLSRVFIPKAAVNLDGLRQVIEMFWEAEGLKSPLPSPEKYVDLSYYAKALGRR